MKKVNTLFQFIIILVVAIYAVLVSQVAIGQVVKNRSYEFFLSDQYFLVTPSSIGSTYSTVGVDYQSYIGPRKIYRINNFYLNYVSKGKLSAGINLYSDVEEEFTSLTSLGGSLSYEILNHEEWRVIAAMRFNGWNHLVKGNQFIAGTSSFAFNMDAGITGYWEDLEVSLGLNNMVPVVFEPLDQKVVLRREVNFFIRNSINKNLEAYSYFGGIEGFYHYMGGLVYGFEEKVFPQVQWSSRYGVSVGGKLLLGGLKKTNYSIALNYGVSGGRYRVSQYRVDLAVLFK